MQIMKKPLILALFIVLCLSLAACGGNAASQSGDPASEAASQLDGATAQSEESQADESTASAPSQSEPEAQSEESQAAEPETESEAPQPAEAAGGSSTVEITIPAAFLEEIPALENLDEAAKADGIESITLNDDGGATIVMSKSNHDELMAEVRATIDQAMEEMADPERFPTFVKVSANDDYSHFTIELSSDEVGLTESVSVLGFYMLGGMYNVFNGAAADDITVTFVNAGTGDIISELHSSNMPE